MAEGKPVAIYYADLSGGAGWRSALGQGHHVALLGGLQGSGGLALQSDFKAIRLPEASVSYQYHTNKVFVEVGPLGGWSLAARMSVGEKLVGSNKVDADFFANTHYFRPYAGAQASVVVMPLMMTLLFRRTFLGSGDTGTRLDQGHAQICLRIGKTGEWLVTGGCLTADMVRGEVVRVSPQPGPGGDGWSYRTALDFMFAWGQSR
jgi:hypothetical protein